MTLTSQVTLDNRPPAVSVVIPLYRSRKNFENILDLSRQLFPLFDSKSELLLINDGDPDLFDVSIYDEFLIIGCPVQLVTLKQNFGQMTATLCGLSMAKSPTVLTVDADTCCNARLLRDLVLKSQTARHLAYLNVLSTTSKRPLLRDVLSQVNKKVFAYLVKNIDLRNYSGSSVRAVERSLVESLLEEGVCAELIDIWLLNAAVKTSFIPYQGTKEYSTSYSAWSLVLFVFRFVKCFVKKRTPFNATDYIYQTEKLAG